MTEGRKGLEGRCLRHGSSRHRLARGNCRHYGTALAGPNPSLPQAVHVGSREVSTSGAVAVAVAVDVACICNCDINTQS